LEPFAAGSFPAFQLNPSQKPFVAFGIVPIAAIHQKAELTFIFEFGTRLRSFEDPMATFAFADS
jgi:hypothetical protein